jgi:drug/metabolite transporter (DMT)-like permease
MSGPSLALLAAALFGASTPLAKLLLGGGIAPAMLAGLLYLGSGIGLALFRLLRGAVVGGEREAGVLRGAEWLWLAGAILAGGVVGPLLLMAGLSTTAGASASLLLNLEGVFTTLIAWFVFKENFDRRILLGVACITAGAVLLSGRGGLVLGPLGGPLAIAGACLAWAVDNNLTRRVSLNDASFIAMLKGCAAGLVNVAIALASGSSFPAAALLAGAALVGFLGYGVSLALFVVALRQLGAARTGAYFSTAPFIGAVVAILALGEPASPQLIGAGVLMALGLWLHLSERHEHEHEHEATRHEHPHSHDEHHRHSHDGDAPAGEPHSHLHSHGRLRHRHPHYPDAHHRHSH